MSQLKSKSPNLMLIIALVALPLLGGCVDRQSDTLDNLKEYSAWSVGYVAPTYYPVDIRSIDPTDNEGNSITEIGAQVPSVGETLKEVRQYFPHYDGYALPVDMLTFQTRRQLGIGTKVLPDMITIHWVSLINVKFYETRLKITKSIKQKINKTILVRLIWSPDTVVKCHYSHFIFGFIPNGDVKVWLGGCSQLDYIETLKPYKIEHQGANDFLRKMYKKELQQTMFKHFKKIGYPNPLPIQWDKIDKVLKRKYIGNGQWKTVEGTH
ncbi:DUF2931 family protein [Celerinatantimonas yamalensis]|uniref:DUF2931 family protein n=1 Tax=Celerinatantimonas yamalensis TaxID=559956 RepID=A0ABW9GBD8_9GAMM